MFLRFAVPALLAYVMFLSLPAQAQSAYRWVDNEGRVHYSDQPPMPAEARAVERRKLDTGATDSAFSESLAMKKAARDFPLTLYTAPACKESCQSARDFLAQRKLPFVEKILQTSEDFDYYKNHTGSSDFAVPLLQAGGIGGKYEKGFNAAGWRKLLEASGYPLEKNSEAVPAK